MQTTTEKTLLLDKIIDNEQKMFIKVKSVEPACCQSMLKTFRAMRAMSFSVLNMDTLESYYRDLQEAVIAGRNLVTEKYARMDNLIPVINDNPIIIEIVNIEREWLWQLHEQFPLTIRLQGEFSNYASCELETYSNETLGLYYRDLFIAKTAGKNLVAERYLYLYQKMGFTSLAEVEAMAKKKTEAQ
ncbi:MAG: DUF4125 family protein [Acidaminococcaceae bacterium]